MKGKKATIFVLAMLLSLSIPAAFSKNDNFGVDYIFEPYQDGCGQWMIKDTMIYSVPGSPLVPYKTASILLPGSTELKDVKVKHGKPIIQSGFDLPWGQPPCTFSDTPVTVGRNEEIYNSDNLYPNKLFEVVGVECCKGFAILNVHLYPVQYQAKSQTVHFYEKLTVEVQVGKGVKNKLYRGLEADKKDVAGIVSNPEMVDTYDDGPQPLATEEYIIITSSTLSSTFQQLANWKASYVVGASVYTLEYIYSEYTEGDNQKKIRDFITDKWEYNGTNYVLLGGDTGVVPYRGFYASTGGYTDSDMAADMYYGHLNGTFNADGDSRYGETNDGVDYYAEVAVGRAPCQSVTEAQNFVNKVIAYEQADKPKRVILHESRVQAGNSPDARCLAYGCDNYIPGDYTINYLFEESGTVTKTAWINAWAQGPGSIAVAHIGHGNTNVYYINYEIGGTVSWYNSDVASMTNTFWPWTTSVACITGQIEANDCLAEAYVMDANNGAIAAIYNDNYGWFNTGNACMYSGEFCITEFRACWSDGKQKLGDFLNRSRYYLASSAQSNSTYRWCFYERNLVGDPETPCLTKRGGAPPPDSVTITNPSNGATVAGTVNITTSTTGAINEVRFYIDGSLKYTDTTSPFSWSWDTTAYSEGSHTIRVDGYASGVFKDDGTVTVNVDNGSDYYVTITNPTEGQTVSGTVTCAANSNCSSVRWYIDGTYKAEDASAPFQYSWDTTAYSNSNHTVKAEGYINGVKQAEDMNTANVDNYPYVEIANPPQQGETVSCTVTIDVETNCADTVELYFDGVLIYTDTTAPFQYVWDTCLSQDGSHTVTVKGYDSGVFIDSDTATYQVYHYYVRITNPQQGETVSGIVPITIDANCVDTVELYIDDVLKHTEFIDPPHEGGTFQYEWNTYPYSKGYHTIKVKGYEAGQFKRFDEISVYVNNPHIEITNPQDGETVSCTVTITTDVSEEVNTVKFLIDGVVKCVVNGAPFQCTWDTCDYSNGTHTITAQAYGEQPLSEGEILDVLIDFDTVTVQVDNDFIAITSPQDGEEVFGTVDITTETSCCINEVVFYIDGQEKGRFFGAPYQYSWDTTTYAEDEQHTIRVEGYYYGQLKGEDTVVVTVDNCGIWITSPQDEEEVSDTVTITVDARCIDIVQFYIDEYCLGTDCEAPFEYEWDTNGYGEDEQYTICVKGFTNDQIPNCSEQLSSYSEQPEILPIEPEDIDCIVVTVNSIYVTVTSPQEGEEVSGTYLITTDTKGIDTVRFYIDDINNPCECEDTEEPFECNWDTTGDSDGDHTIIAKGYAEGDFQDQDTVTCTVCNGSAGLWLGILVGCAGITKRRH